MDATTNDPLPCAACQVEMPAQDLINVGGYPTCRACVERLSGSSAMGAGKKRRFYKVREGKELAGVAAGLADAANFDRGSFRFLATVAIVLTGIIPGVIAYLVLAFVLPFEGEAPGRPRLAKIQKGKQMAGVAGGLANWINMDQDTMRFIVAFLILLTGIIPGLIAYMILAFILPVEDEIPV